MSEHMETKPESTRPESSAMPGRRKMASPPESVELKSSLDRVIEILRGIPTARRYGGEETAITEATEILESVKEKL